MTSKPIVVSPPGIRVLTALFAVIVVVSPTFADSIKFDLAPRHRIGLNSTDVVYSDLDGDGYLDLAAVNGGQGNPDPTMTLRFGSAGGDFSEPMVIQTLTIGQSIEAGDLNSDGLPDLVIASWYHNRLAVFLNQGDRQFAAPWFSAPPDPPYGGSPTTSVGEFFDVAIADFDGDGNKDVVALQDQVNQRLRFFNFSGQGQLTVFATIDQQETGTSYERIIEIGDINGDGRSDLIFAGGGPFGDRNISFVFGAAVGGTLSLTFGFPVVDESVGMKLSDLDNDGDKDLAVAFLDTTTPTRHSLQVFKNNGFAVFTPLPANFLEYPFPPADITTDDFNDDGLEDIGALISSVTDSGVMVLVMNGVGDGTFTGEKYYGTSSSSTIFSTDVDQDGNVDLLTASSFLDQTNYAEDGNTVSILYNGGIHGFRAPLVTLWGPTFIDAADFDNDGYKDLASSWESSFTGTSGVDLLINDRARSFHLPEVHHPSPAALNGMRTGDFNGDGNWDAVSIHEDNARLLALYRGNGTSALSAPVLTQLPRGLVSICVGDFNGDKRSDVLVIDDLGHGYTMLGNSNGTFSTAPGSPMVFTNTARYRPASGDFNGDKNEDLIIAMNSTLKLWLGDGTGRFAESSAVIPPMSLATAGDFNGDGHLDLAGMSKDGILGVLGDGTGGFGPGFYRPIEGTYSIILTSSVVSEDFDGDGSDEIALLMADNLNGNVIVMQYDGTKGTSSWRSPLFYGVGPASRTWGGMLIATDFNGDDRPDLGFLGTNARGVVYNASDAPAPSAPFDFDGDGRTDVGIYRPVVGEWWYLRSSDGGNRAFAFGNATDALVPGDYTGDGKADQAFYRNGEWFVLRSNDFSFFSFPFGNATDTPAPADYDGDGKTDAAVFRSLTGTWYIQRSSDNQTVIQGFGQTGDRPVAADYDGDGKADIAIFRPSLGQWWLNRSTQGVIAITFGNSADRNVPGDYTGDGKADVALFRPSTNEWFVLRSNDLSFYSFPFGAAGDVPAPGDYDGDGKTDGAVFRPSNSTWYVQRSTAGALIQQFGAAGDQPVPGAFVR